MEVREINKKKTNTLPRSEIEELIKKKRNEDEEICKGMFEFIDAQGGWFEHSYRIYPGEPIQILKFTHGEICSIPMGIVKHLNNTVRKVRKYSLEFPADGKRIPRSYQTFSRVRFTPMDVL